MIVITRFEVAETDVAAFLDSAQAAIAVLAGRPGFLTADLGQNLDEPRLWALALRWTDVGSYRRALQGYESKTVVVPLLSHAFDEPSAYEAPDLL